MILLSKITREKTVQSLHINLISKRDDNEGHEKPLRAEDNLPVCMLHVYPEGLEGGEGILDFVLGHPLLVDGNLESLRRLPGVEGECEGRYQDEDAEDDVAEYGRGDSDRD